MSHCLHCLRAPRAPGEGSAAPRDQAQPCFASATTRWYGQQPWESSSFSKVCLLYKHNCKMEAKCRRWRGWSKGGERQRSWRWPATPSPAPAAGVEEERSCIPSCCQAAQTLLSSNFTWPEQFREGQGRRRQLGDGGGGGSQGVMLNYSQAPRPCWTQKNHCFHRLVI